MNFSNDVVTTYLRDVEDFNNTFVDNLKVTQDYTEITKFTTDDIMKLEEFGCSIKTTSDIFKDVSSDGLGCCKDVTV